MISQFLGSRKASQAPSLMVPRVGCPCAEAPDTSIGSCAKMPAFFSFAEQLTRGSIFYGQTSNTGPSM